MTHGLGSTLSKNVSSLALTIWELWYFKDLEEKKESVSQLINKWVTRLFVEQASATPGLLIILNNFLVLVFLLSAICFFPCVHSRSTRKIWPSRLWSAYTDNEEWQVIYITRTLASILNNEQIFVNLLDFAFILNMWLWAAFIELWFLIPLKIPRIIHVFVFRVLFKYVAQYCFD